MELRPYQQSIIDQVRQAFQDGKRAPIIVSPTGSGKTVMFCAFTQLSRARSKRILILAHRSELLDQISRTLHEFRIPHSFIAPGRTYYPQAQVQVGSVFTVAKRLARMAAPDLIIIDEAHHGTLKSTWGRVLSTWPAAFRIGVTATPARLSGEALGDLFDHLILGPSVADLITQGSLSPFRIWAPPSMDTEGIATRAGDFAQNELAILADKPSITGNAVDHYLKHAKFKRAVAFCVSRQHAKHVAEQFSKAGIVSESIDGSLASDTRASLIKNFKDGVIQVLTSCDLISEGMDIPAIECAILLRPTKSLTLALQQIGRALRPYPGKEYAVILDHAGNVHRHGLPDEPRDWTLAGRIKSGGEYKVPIRICPMCFGANRGGVMVCAYCGHRFLIEAREVEQRQGTLEELNGQLLLKLKKKREQGMAQSFGDLVALAKQRGYKNPTGYAAVVMAARKKKEAAS